MPKNLTVPLVELPTAGIKPLQVSISALPLAQAAQLGINF